MDQKGLSHSGSNWLERSSHISALVTAVATAIIAVVAFGFGRVEFDYVIDCLNDKEITVEIYQLTDKKLPVKSVRTLVRGEEHLIDDRLRNPLIQGTDPVIYHLKIPRSDFCNDGQCDDRPISRVELEYKVGTFKFLKKKRRGILLCSDSAP